MCTCMRVGVYVCVCGGGGLDLTLMLIARVRSKPHAFPDFNLHGVCNILGKKKKKTGEKPRNDAGSGCESMCGCT